MTDKKDEVKDAKTGTVEDQTSGAAARNPSLSTRPMLDAEQAALAAKILRGQDGDGSVSQEAKDDLANHLDAIANYNGD